MEVRWTTINNELRYEAEFFKKRFLKEDTALSRWPTQEIGKFAHVTDGPHGYHVVDEASPIVMLTAKNAKNWFSERVGADPIATWVDAANKRSSLEENDIILSTRGTVGLCALVTKESLPANIDQDVARISWPDIKTFIPGFIVAYLNSSYGQDHITRYASGMVQQGLSLQKVREIPIPLLSPSFQEAIANIVTTALNLRQQVSSHTRRAEKTLLHALGLDNWQVPGSLTYTRSSRDAFAAGRLDAEYFTPRISALRTLLGRDGLCLADVASVRHERFKAEGAGNFEYIEIGGVQADGTVIAETTPLLEAPSRATQHVRNGDVVTSTVRPIRRLSALISEEQDGAVCSSGFVVLEPDAIAPETLLTYLRLSPICELMDLHTSASLYPAISEKDLMALPVPRIDVNTQASVKSYVQSAQQTRHRAAQFIAAAKRAVEIAIEQNEAAGLAYLAAQSALSPGVESSASTAGYLQ